MEIKVPVLNKSNQEKKEEKELSKPVILTPDYVKKLNKQIEYNIRAREINTTPNSLTLKRNIR